MGDSFPMEAFGCTVLLFFALFVFAHPARASCVHPAGLAGCFTTIHAAVDAALPGETIEIDAGS